MGDCEGGWFEFRINLPSQSSSAYRGPTWTQGVVWIRDEVYCNNTTSRVQITYLSYGDGNGVVRKIPFNAVTILMALQVKSEVEEYIQIFRFTLYLCR